MRKRGIGGEGGKGREKTRKGKCREKKRREEEEEEKKKQWRGKKRTEMMCDNIGSK